jgi:hypothetical protein
VPTLRAVKRVTSYKPANTTALLGDGPARGIDVLDAQRAVEPRARQQPLGGYSLRVDVAVRVRRRHRVQDLRHLPAPFVSLAVLIVSRGYPTAEKMGHLANTLAP